MKVKKENLKITLSLVQIVLLIAVLVQIGGIKDVMSGGAVAVGDAPSAPPSAPSEPRVADFKVLEDDDPVKGDKNAPVTIVEFSDYECPFCARFYSQTLPQIEEKYIKTGKVKLIYRDFPLSFHQLAQKAGEAAECAGEQGKYFEMHDKLFENGVTGGVAGYKQFAAQMGLDQAKFDTCLDTGAQAAEVKKDMADGAQYGVTGTPGFFVNGRLISGAQPFPVFEQAIEAALNE